MHETMKPPEPQGPAMRLRGIVKGELLAALKAVAPLGPFTYRNRPISLENLDRLVGLGLIEAYVAKEVSDLRYRVSGIGIHCLRAWKEIAGLDAKTEVCLITGGRMSKNEAEFYESDQYRMIRKYEKDEDFDERMLVTLLQEGCVVGIPNMMDKLDYLNPNRIKASIYRLDERGLVQWDITDSIYLTVKGVEVATKARDAA